MADRDSGYKLLFSHKEMIRDLLVGFVHEEWVALLDLDSLEPVQKSFVSDDLRQREDDVIWRVRFADDWLLPHASDSRAATFTMPQGRRKKTRHAEPRLRPSAAA